MNVFTNDIEFRKWIYIFIILFVIGLLNFSIIVTEKSIYDENVEFIYPFVNEMTGSLTTIIPLPLLLGLFNKHPIRLTNIFYSLPIYLFASVVFGVTHTLLMTVSRAAIYPLLDMGNYDPGIFHLRLLMEYQKQFIVFWLVYAVVYFVNAYKEKQKEKLKAADLEKQLTKAQLSNLQNQLNPHFLFNTLNMISSEMYNNPKAADTLIANLSDLLRSSFTTIKNEKHTFNEEIKLTNLYLDIMKARYREKLNVKFNIDSEAHSALIPWFTFQPFVENSIKFGIEENEKVNITITSLVSANNLIISIEDDGPGINNDESDYFNKGVGLSNMKERLEKLYDGKGSLTLRENLQGGVTIKIIIPFEIGEEA